MTEIGLGHYLTLGAVIFSIGIIGIFFKSKKYHCNFNEHRTNIVSS